MLGSTQTQNHHYFLAETLWENFGLSFRPAQKDIRLWHFLNWNFANFETKYVHKLDRLSRKDDKIKSTHSTNYVDNFHYNDYSFATSLVGGISMNFAQKILILFAYHNYSAQVMSSWANEQPEQNMSRLSTMLS